MLETLKTFLLIIKSNRLYILIVLLLSILGASINEVMYKPKYIAQFEVAPHFEFAYDLGRQLDQIVHDLNHFNVQELSAKRGLNLDKEKIFNCSFKQYNSPTEDNFKHIKLRVTVESHKKDCNEFKIIDNYLVTFCNNFINDTTKRYKGLEVLKTKLKLFSTGDTSVIRDYQLTKSYFKHKMLNHDIAISDEIVSKIIHAEVAGELKNAKQNNFNNLLQNNIKIKPRLFKALDLFIIISLVPCLILISILRAKKYD